MSAVIEFVHVPQVSQNTFWKCLISARSLGIIRSDQKVGGTQAFLNVCHTASISLRDGHFSR